jgi:hypothetical protein
MPVQALTVNAGTSASSTVTFNGQFYFLIYRQPKISYFCAVNGYPDKQGVIGFSGAGQFFN